MVAEFEADGEAAYCGCEARAKVELGALSSDPSIRRLELTNEAVCVILGVKNLYLDFGFLQGDPTCVSHTHLNEVGSEKQWIVIDYLHREAFRGSVSICSIGHFRFQPDCLRKHAKWRMQYESIYISPEGNVSRV